jgi:hypothetical protein
VRAEGGLLQSVPTEGSNDHPKLNLKVCDDGVLLKQQTSWTLSIVLM